MNFQKWELFSGSPGSKYISNQIFRLNDSRCFERDYNFEDKVLSGIHVIGPRLQWNRVRWGGGAREA